MENATKALLIAAGILVTILIISIGIFVFNSSSSTTDEMGATMSELEIKKFNKKYEQYEGVRGGKTVKTLLGYVIDDNQYANERDGKTGINLRSNITSLINAFPSWGNALTTRPNGVMYTSNISKFRDKINNSSKYKVWFSYNKYGLVHEIHIDNP